MKFSGTFRRKGCKCDNKKRCRCGAKVSYRYDEINPITGKRIQRETKGFGTMTEAREEALRIQTRLDGVLSHKVTFAQYADDFLERRVATNRIRRSTHFSYSNWLKIAKRYMNDIKLEDISFTIYQTTLNKICDDGYSSSTITSVHTICNMVFKDAIKHRVISQNPAKFAEIPIAKRKPNRIKLLTTEELNKLLDGARTHGIDDRDYVLLTILVHTGMRIGEVCALAPEDIIEAKKQIVVRKSYTRTKDGSVIGPTKTGHERIVDITETVKNVITSIKPHSKTSIFGFTPEVGRNRIIALAKALEMPHITPHIFRHTHISTLAEIGVPIATTMQRVGHVTMKTTIEIYSHVSSRMASEAASKFEEYVKCGENVGSDE